MSAGGPRLAEDFPGAAGLGSELLARSLTVACAESCTGGLLGAALTAVPGSSRYVRGGVVAYDNEVKERLLGVAPSLLREHGAVSAEVAAAMAEGVTAACDAGLGLAVTGVAGPDGGTAEKPVGLIWIAAALRGRPPEVRRLQGSGDREANRALAVREIIGLALQVLEEG